MAYVPTADDVTKVRYEVQDIDVALPILPDATYEYILTKNSGSISASSIDAARLVLMRLSFSGDSTVDIISLKGSKVAEQYRLALQMYLRDPNMNPILKNTSIYAGSISKSDMQSNIDNSDNNSVQSPALTPIITIVDPKVNPFGI